MSASSGRQRLRNVAFAATLLLSATMVLAAGWQISLNIRFADLLKISDELDREDRISTQALERRMPDTAVIVTDGICRTDIIQAGKKLVMRDLDRRNPRDTATWEPALAEAERYIRHGLSCLPANGDLWLRLAMLREARSAAPEEIASLMQQSQMLNPAEASIIAARMSVWTRLPATTTAMALRAFNADMAILCSEMGAKIRKQFPETCAVQGKS